MKKITHLLILFLFFTTEMFCQVSIGSGTNRQQGMPFDPGYQRSYTQSIYKASEINSSGEITAIQWHFNGTSALPNSQDLVIYLGHTTKNVFSNTNDWEVIDNLTEVYTGGITTSGTGWVTITFDTPFDYNGTSNLIVAVNERMPNSDSYTEDFYNSEVVGNRSIYSNSNTFNVAVPTAGSLATFVPNVIFEGISQSCVNPSDLAITELLNDTASFSWSTNGTENSWETLVIPSTSAEPTSTTSGIFIAGNTEYTALELLPSTNYNFYVRSFCGSEYSSWVGPINFTTQCAPVNEFNEGFDLSTANLPSCWKKIGTNGSAYAQSEQNALSAPNILYFNNSSQTDRSVLALPLVNNASDATHRLRFSARGSYATGSIIEVGYLTNILDASSFVTLESFAVSSSSTYDTHIAELGTNPLSNNLALRHSGVPSNPVYVDNVVWEPIPYCGDIINLATASVFDTNATISWEENGDSSWQYAFGTATTVNPINLTPITVTEAQATINSLAPSTFYKVWVRTDCGSGDVGSWAGPISFTTQCSPVTEISESFDASTTLPACWRRVAGNGSVNIQSVTGAPTSPNALNISNLTPSATTKLTVVALPYVSNLADGSHRLRFKARAVSTAGGNIEVGYITNIIDPQSFVALQTFTINSTTAFQTYIVTPEAGSYTGNLAFRHTGVPTNPIYIDDVLWEALPECSDINNLAYSNLGSNSVHFSWDTNGSETTWQYAIGASTVTNPSTLTLVDVTGNPEVLISSLQPSTAYRIWVRSNCGNGAFGAWAGPVNITTQCSEVAAFVEYFDSSTSLPGCFKKIGTDGSLFIQNSGTGAFSAPNNLYMYSTLLAMPPVSNASAGTHRLKFKARGAYSAGGNSIIVGYLNDNNGTVSFVPIQTFTATSSTVYETFSAELGTQPLSNTIAIKHTGQNAVVLDDIIWELLPTCADVYNIAYENILTTSATINWQTNGTETAWEYALGTAIAVNPNDLTAVPVNDTVAELDNLSASTSYKIWVRSNCGSGSYGSWTGPFNFTTPCSSVETFSENFDASTNFPNCFKKVGTSGSAYVQNAGSNAASTPNNVFLYASILALPPVSNANAGTHSLKFKARSAYTAGNNTIEVGYLTDVNDANSFVSLQTFMASSVTDYDIFTAELGTQPLSNTIAIKHSGINSVVLDDISWQPILSTGDFNSNAFNFYPNPVKNSLNLSYNQDIESVTVFNLLGQEVAKQKVNSNQAQIDMSFLNSGTYIVKISAENQIKTIKILKN